MGLLKYIRKPQVRASAESALLTSATVPNSGLKFVDNSQGCSAAIAELSGLLDVALDQFDSEGDTSDQLRLQLKRLYDEASQYTNSRVDESSKSEQWQCYVLTRHEAQLVSIAFESAAAVYQQEKAPSVPGFIFQDGIRVAPSIGGTVKATNFFIVKAASPGPEPNPLLPLLVVSLRGTASRVDRMVNMNGESRDMGISVKDRHIYAHAGFLNGAESLMPLVSKKLAEVARENSVKHILFTGHSAGGAVASLLFAKFFSIAGAEYPSIKFSLVSFGAPPVTQPSFDSNALSYVSDINRGIALSIVNEYDLVPRVDQAYIRSLVDLYRSIYSLPPIQEVLSKDDSDNFVLPKLSFDLRNESSERKLGNKWALPRPVYWHIGQLVLLKIKLVEREGNKTQEDEWGLNAVTIAPEDFANLLFCNVDIHKRLRYQERVEMLLEGRFNRKVSW